MVDKDLAVIGRKLGVREVYVIIDVKMSVLDMHGTYQRTHCAPQVCDFFRYCGYNPTEG